MTSDLKNLSRRAALAIAAAAVTLPRATAQTPPTKPKKIGIVLFPGFETLDVFGPVQMWARLPEHELMTVSEKGGPVRSTQGIETIAAYSFATAPQFDILMVPGGEGFRVQLENPAMLNFLRNQDKGTSWTTSVCVGSTLLAKAGLLKGKNATSNKRGFDFVKTVDTDVHWQGHARWVVDGKYVTSSGVSAGTDMALALVEKIYGKAEAEKAWRIAEYTWNSDAGNDPFAVP